MSIILYTTKCPKCLTLEKRLNQKGISYHEINDIETMIAKGFMQVPMLEIDGEIMDFLTANKWLDNLEDNNQ